MSYVVTVCATTENVMLFRLYKIYFRSCSSSTPTNHSDQPLDDHDQVYLAFTSRPPEG